MRDGLLSKIREVIDSRTEATPCGCDPDACLNAFCRNGNWCTLYSCSLTELPTENCELGVTGEYHSFLDILREVNLSLSMRGDKKDFEYECSLLYNACIHALEGKGRYTLVLEENHCATCANRKDGWCDVVKFQAPDCDTCNCYTPLAYEPRHFDPLCF